jgi:hypothetical protein
VTSLLKAALKAALTSRIESRIDNEVGVANKGFTAMLALMESRGTTAVTT